MSAQCSQPADPEDIVAVWDVPLQDRVHQVQFEHGTTTGKRVIRVDKKEILRRDWMFKLVGREVFKVGKANCAIAVEAAGSFAYEYTLEVNGKTYKKFTEQMSKVLETWTAELDGLPTRICLQKDSLDVWVNATKAQTAGEFVEDGTETHFEVGKHVCCIKAGSSGKRRTGMVHRLIIDGNEISHSNVMTQ